MDNMNEVQLIYNETLNKLLENQNNQMRNLRKICIACLISSAVIVTTTLGGILYFLSAYSVEVEDTVTTTYEQQSDGESSIINGNKYDGNATHNEGVDK